MEAPTEPFSDELEDWLGGDGDKTLGGLQEVFEERTFAVTILLLMAPTALPLPTGGLTYVLEASTVLLALEMVAGQRTVWLPNRWRRRSLGPLTTERAIPALLKVVRRAERWARPRGGSLIELDWFWRLLGLLLGALTTAAALAPPFSGLDTLPALGVVLIALAILFQDLLLAAIGLVIGVAGVALTVALGAATARLLRDLF